MMNEEIKNAIREIKKNNEKFDMIDCFIEKFEDYVEDKEHKSERKLSDFLNALENIDERFLLIRLFGNYHYQVNNGGHYQYFDNGYCSTDDIDRGCFGNKSEELDLHKEMISLFKKYLPKTETTCEFINNLERFISCVDYDDCECCDGSGYIENEDEECCYCHRDGYVEENDEEVECDNCCGRGYIDGENEECWECHGTGKSRYLTVTDQDFLDNTYYSISDEVVNEINKMAEKWINSDDDCVLNEFADGSYNHTNTLKTKLKLVGTDGNAFAILGKVKEALNNKNVAKDIICDFMKEATSGDYNNLLATCIKYCENANIEVC